MLAEPGLPGLRRSPHVKYGKIFWTVQLGEDAALVASHYIKGYALMASCLSSSSHRTVG